MIQKTIFLTAIIVISIILLSTISVIAYNQIRPAPQTESRGVGEQIRPANQQDIPSTGNGNYQASEGSSYSSSVNQAPPISDSVKLSATLNNTDLNTTSNATGDASFVLNKTSNTMTYSINYTGLNSNETGAEIDVPGLLIDNQTVSYQLSLGEIKQGMISFAQIVQDYIINGQALVKIRSLLFPDGEVSGYIRLV